MQFWRLSSPQNHTQKHPPQNLSALQFDLLAWTVLNQPKIRSNKSLKFSSVLAHWESGWSDLTNGRLPLHTVNLHLKSKWIHHTCFRYLVKIPTTALFQLISYVYGVSTALHPKMDIFSHLFSHRGTHSSKRQENKIDSNQLVLKNTIIFITDTLSSNTSYQRISLSVPLTTLIPILRAEPTMERHTFCSGTCLKGLSWDLSFAISYTFFRVMSLYLFPWKKETEILPLDRQVVTLWPGENVSVGKWDFTSNPAIVQESK